MSAPAVDGDWVAGFRAVEDDLFAEDRAFERRARDFVRERSHVPGVARIRVVRRFERIHRVLTSGAPSGVFHNYAFA